MKTKMITLLKISIAVIAGALSCFIIYYCVDVLFNGSFVDWFMRNYMSTSNDYDYTLQEEILRTEPVWSALKSLLITVFIIVTIAVLLLVMTVSHFHAKNKIRETISRTARLMKDFINQTEEDRTIFPQGYAEIETQLVQIKAIMQRHEHIIKEEGSRKNDLITYLAHDLKTPLTSVIGYLNLLDEVPDLPDTQREKYVGIALEKANRSEGLINEFFEITRYNLQQIILEKVQIDLYFMLMQMTDEFYPLLKPQGKKVSLHANENMMVLADPVKLARVFNNILKNAVVYSEDNSIIHITAERRAENIVVSFLNTGRTIPKEKLEIIFEKFFRLDEARTTNTGGAGLGLAIAKEIVDLHGGTITADSKDGVTVFVVSLSIHGTEHN